MAKDVSIRSIYARLHERFSNRSTTSVTFTLASFQRLVISLTNELKNVLD